MRFPFPLQFAFGVVATIGFTPTMAEETADSQSVIQAVLQSLEANAISDAADAITQLAWDHPADARLIAATLKTATVLEREGEVDRAADLSHRAAHWLLNGSPEEVSIPDAKRDTIWLLSARRLNRVARFEDALVWIAAIEKNTAFPSAEFQSQVHQLAMQVAAGSLDAQQPALAARSYQIAINHAGDADLATARLGLAWSRTLSGQDPAAALQATESYLAYHEDHVDVPSALLLQLSCLTQLGEDTRVAEVRTQLIERFPESGATRSAVAAYCDARGVPATPASIEPAVASYLTAFMTDEEPELAEASLAFLTHGLYAGIECGKAKPERIYASRIAIVDETGQTATQVLQTLMEADRVAAAERVAIQWLSPARHANDPKGDTDIELCAGVREAASRWAGRTDRWLLLAHAASESDAGLSPESSEYRAAGRCLAVDRLLAESLVQMGRSREALLWWRSIVDQHAVDDFPTLLRLAEVASAAADRTEAHQRLAAARRAASSTDAYPTATSLVDLLDAELHIRDLRFDESRSLLERVVRAAEASQELRGRAQWMIGETYLMQRQYQPAIEAYRLVEGISGGGVWAAAALRQAGGAFEQLGKTRQAAVCYSALLSRFGDSPHAEGARERLAAIAPDPSLPNAPLRR
ncbi:MAG: hypothetical protein AAGD07_14920 [Planctomycetota bacterium]